jgi:spore germination protein KC
MCSIIGGCYDANELDEFAYVTAIGLDKGKTNVLQLTLQIANPTAIAGGGGDSGGAGGGEGEKSTVSLTLDTPTIMSGLNMANNYVSKQMDLSHANLMIFSEELARGGISKYIFALPKVREIRPNINIAVARGSAKDYLSQVKPQLVKNPTKYYELLYSSYKHTGFTANSQLHRFYTLSKVGYMQPVAVLAGVGRFNSSDEFTSEYSTYREKGRAMPLEGDFKAGDAPKEYKSKSEIMALAVFDGGRMVGELDGEETYYFLMASNQYNHSYFTVPDPERPEKLTILIIRKSRSPQTSVQIADGKPVISLRIMLEADITTIQSGINYEDPKNTYILEEHYENFIKNGMTRFLNRTAREFHSDICGFGSYVKGKFLTWNEWESFNWLERYKDSSFNVDVDLKIRRPGVTIRALPVISSEGEEK